MSHTNATGETLSPHPRSEDYKLLRGHARSDGSWKTDKQLRMEYLHLTDELIRKITEGVDVVDRQTGETVIKKPDTVIFLDKSARPVSWLMKEAWSTLASDSKGNTPDMPDIRYLNIDREQWVNTVDPQGVGRMDIAKVDQSIIRSLRSVFISPAHKQTGLTEEIDAASTSLDHKTVLVVDEVFSTGRTLQIAQKFIERAFPDTNVAATHWMKGVSTDRGGLSVGNKDLPVWYNDKTEKGRGIGNRLRDPGDSKSNNITQRLGGWFLSSRLAEPDDLSDQLRFEFKQLATRPDVPIRPSIERDDYDERVARLNNTSFETAQADILDVLHTK